MNLVFTLERFLSRHFYNKIMTLEFVGYLGGFLIAVALTPQLVKT